MSESLTERSGQGWALRTGVNCAAAIERLARYEQCRDSARAEYAGIERKLESLRAQGRQNSATFRQLLGQKLTLSAVLARYDAFGL